MRPRSPSEALEPQRAPQRPRNIKVRRESKIVSGFVRVISGILTVVVVTMLALGSGALVLNHIYERPGPLDVSRTIVIQKGDGRIAIADNLEREGVISNRWGFVANHLLRNYFGRGKTVELKAGEYEFKKAASMRQVLETIGEGKSILYKVTVPEGLTSQQIVERLKADETLTGDIAAVPAEGTLLPDTYRVSKGMARQELIERMQAEQKRLLDAVWEKRKADLPITSPEQTIVMASIVEKETGRPDERDRVAAVFINRLNKKMRLQSDPTIIYGIVGGQGPLGRSITRTDIDTKTPYNTYRVGGLPPGPICNPGRAAIEATLNPAATTDLYFVADGKGGHSFSDTLSEHNSAVQTWRQVEKEQKTDDEAEAVPAKAGAKGAGKSDDKSADKSVVKPDGDTPAVDAKGDGAKASAAAAAGAKAGDAKKGEMRAAVREAPPPAVVPAAAEAAEAIPNPPAEAPAVVPAPATASASSIPLPVRKPKK
jgi:UPF0755 protein